MQVVAPMSPGDCMDRPKLTVSLPPLEGGAYTVAVSVLVLPGVVGCISLHPHYILLYKWDNKLVCLSVNVLSREVRRAVGGWGS